MVHELAELAVELAEDVVLLRLRQLLVLHRLIEVALHRSRDRALQPVDRLVLVARDVRQGLAGAELAEQLLVAEAEVLGGGVDAVVNRADEAVEEAGATRTEAA